MYYDTFKKLCDEKGVTPSAVSKATGIATSTFTNWKKGLFTPKLDKLERVADYFNVPLSFLTGRESTYRELHEAIKSKFENNEDPAPAKGFYLDADVIEMSENARSMPGMKRLYKLTGKVEPKDFQLVEDFLKRITGADEDDYAE